MIPIKNKILQGLLIFSILLMGWGFRFQTEQMPFGVLIRSGSKEEQIKVRENALGEYYVFLPSYTQLEQVRVYLHTSDSVSLNGVQLEEGMSCDIFQPEVSYILSYSVWGIPKQKTVTFLQSASVATMYIDTQSGNMEYIHRKKGNEESGVMRLYTDEGILEYDGNLSSMNGRGNATWEQSEKKPYSIKLEKEANLLGMGSAEKWILLANAQDPSQIRNKLASELADAMGLQYTAESEWVDLYLNGVYAGLYLLSERNEVHQQRVDIEDDGFLVSMERLDRLKAQKYAHVQTEQGLAFRLHYPLDDELNASVENTLQAVENALLSKDGVDPITGQSWETLIDIESWARMFLMSEIIGNLDSYKVSQYFYRNSEDGRVFAGPIWDSDRALGNDDDPVWSIANPDTFVVCRYLNDDFMGPKWIRNLLKNEQFHKKVVDLFRDEFYPAIEARLDGLIRGYEATIGESFEMNRIRWESEVTCGSMSEETAQVRDYVHKHMEFLYRAWIDEIPYCQINFLDIPNEQFVSVVAGETLTSVPIVENSETKAFLGWYYSDTNEPFDITKPITEDIEIYAKWEDKPVKKFDQMVKLVPLGVIAVIGFGLAWVELKRWKTSR